MANQPSHQVFWKHDSQQPYKENWCSASAAFFQHNSAQKSANYRTNLGVYICIAFLTCSQEDEAANYRADSFKLEQIMDGRTVSLLV